jgi:hypothetical protein
VRVGSGFSTVVGVGACPKCNVGVAVSSVVSVCRCCWNVAVFANGRGGSSRVKITNKLRRDGRRETGDGRRETGDGRRETGFIIFSPQVVYSILDIFL